MKYSNSNEEILVGDAVLVEGDVKGLVVCDFERWLCLAGYEDWLTKEEMVGGGTLSAGVMVETADIGMVHYSEPDEAIVFLKRQKRG